MEKFYLTTSIAYTNAPPHIGFALESIQADVLARWQRKLEKDVFFLTGTDEHGTKIAKKAEDLGKDPQEFVDEISGKFKDLTKALNISNDDFIRTTDRKRHWPVVERFWKKMAENGDIYKKKYSGSYCSGCEAFLSERDLEDGKCLVHKKEPEIIEEENYFFKLSKYQKQLKEIIEKDEYQIVPEGRKNEILSFINQGLEDISFSRSVEKLKWGIPVPGDETQVMYVWADALSNYISALGGEDSKYWPADVHCIGKDILKFHALIWPAMLLSLEIPLPKRLFVHGFITVDGQKMSKSIGNVIDPFELVNKYGADAVRYYLLRELSSSGDGDFTYDKFEERYNSDLASGVGNLLARVKTMAEKVSFKPGLIKDIEPEIKKTQEGYKKALEEFKFNEALKSIWDLIGFCDRYIDKEKPWEHKDNSSRVIDNLLIALDNISELLEPFLPETAEKIKQEIKRKSNKFSNPKSENLFPRLT